LVWVVVLGEGLRSTRVVGLFVTTCFGGPKQRPKAMVVWAVVLELSFLWPRLPSNADI
jgi:hypothetical protein